MNNEQKLLSALVEKPTKYTIDVINSEMLPKNLKEKKALDFVIKPPTIQTLSLCAIHLQDLPKSLLRSEDIDLQDALPYVDNIVKVISTISYCDAEYPDWYEEFLKCNTTPKELFMIFQEVAVKMQSDFFLTSFQIARNTNPMMMSKPKSQNDLIRIS